MKTATITLATMFFFTMSLDAQDVRINEVSPDGDWIELHNQSGSSVDVSQYWFCAQFLYTRLDNGASIAGGPPISTISGSLNIPAGGFLVLSWDIDAAGSDVGLYNDGVVNGASFGNSALMEDFMQYNFTGGRQGVADTKGIWTTGESVPLPPAGKTLSYFGPGTGAGAWDSSENTQGADNTVLPVELASFDARVLNDGVQLLWSTQSEINNLGFEVQMRRQTDLSFRTLSFVEAGPDGSGIQYYDYMVGDVEPGRHQFRLRQVDVGGAKKYSDIVELAVDVPGAFDLSQAYPNPFNHYARFNVAVAREQSVNIELIDMNGRVVQRVFNGTLSEGDSRQFKISSTGLSSGTYFYRVAGENFTTTKSVVLVNPNMDSGAHGCQ